MLLVPGMVAVTVITKLVLNLSHDDGTSTNTAALKLEVAHSGQELLQVDLSSLFVGLEGAPEEHGMITEEPAGETSELPLATDVGTGPEDGEHVLLLNHLEKS